MSSFTPNSSWATMTEPCGPTVVGAATWHRIGALEPATERVTVSFVFVMRSSSADHRGPSIAGWYWYRRYQGRRPA
jgi:hypothetical protein